MSAAPRLKRRPVECLHLRESCESDMLAASKDELAAVPEEEANPGRKV